MDVRVRDGDGEGGLAIGPIRLRRVDVLHDERSLMDESTNGVQRKGRGAPAGSERETPQHLSHARSRMLCSQSIEVG